MSTDKRFYLDCECGCSALSVEYIEDTLYLSYYVNAYYEKQAGINKLKIKLMFLWAIITGKEHQLYEIVIVKEQFEKFKEYLGDLLSKGE